MLRCRCCALRAGNAPETTFWMQMCCLPKPRPILTAITSSRANVSRLGAFSATGCADKPSGTVSYGGCGITSCQEVYPTYYPPLGSCGRCDRVHFRKCIQLEQRGLAMRIGRISPQMERDKFCPIRNRHVCHAGGALEQR